MPNPAGTKVVAAKAAQREAAQRATLDMFLTRTPVEQEFEFDLGAGKVSLLYRAVGAKEYDKLIDLCPATKAQAANDMSVDEDKFRPLLLSKVVAEPAFTQQEWKQILDSPNIGRAEAGELYFTGVQICNRQLGMTGINPTESDSA